MNPRRAWRGFILLVVLSFHLEVRLRMVTDGTLLGGLLADDDMAAV